MWEISSNTRRAIILSTLAVGISCGKASANDTNFYQSNTQFGVNLPNVALPSGSDEVRASDGTSCRSAQGGNGAYLDSGVIGSPGGNGLGESGAIYSRVVIPLGETPRRLDCGALYDLEVQRLRAELQLAKMGLASHGQPTTPSFNASNNENWSTEGVQQKQAAKPRKLPKLATKVSPEPTIAPVADTNMADNRSIIILAPGESIY